jgi:hypothetical protein
METKGLRTLSVNFNPAQRFNLCQTVDFAAAILLLQEFLKERFLGSQSPLESLFFSLRWLFHFDRPSCDWSSTMRIFGTAKSMADLVVNIGRFHIIPAILCVLFRLQEASAVIMNNIYNIACDARLLFSQRRALIAHAVRVDDVAKSLISWMCMTPLISSTVYIQIRKNFGREWFLLLAAGTLHLS